MATKKVTDASFQADVISADTPVVVDFWAEWCGPCKMIGPVLEELSDDYAGKVAIAKVNIDENPDMAGKLGVRSIPTLVMFKGGEPVSMKVGALPKTQLKAWIDGTL
jgi:thioredoxin 1